MSRSSVYLNCMESWWKVLFLVINGSIHFLFLFLYFLCVLCLRQTVKSSCHNKLQRVFSTAEGFCNFPFPNLSQRILLFFLFFWNNFKLLFHQSQQISLWKFRFCSVLVQSIKRPCSAVLIEFLPYWQCTKACYWIFLFFLFFLKPWWDSAVTFHVSVKQLWVIKEILQCYDCDQYPDSSLDGLFFTHLFPWLLFFFNHFSCWKEMNSGRWK